MTASGASPAPGGPLSVITYTTCYAISYGLFFPIVLVARAIPKENDAVRGVIDGARAAIDLVYEIRARSVYG